MPETVPGTLDPGSNTGHFTLSSKIFPPGDVWEETWQFNSKGEDGTISMVAFGGTCEELGLGFG